MGTLKGTTAKIYVDPEATPKFMKARPVPYALKAKVELELDRLQRENIISPVDFSEWAAPIVPVVKQDGSVRICGDYKGTVNQVSKLHNYPIPKTEDLLATLGGGNKFTKLDMSQAYQQLELEESSKKFTTINTHIEDSTNIIDYLLVFLPLQEYSSEQRRTCFKAYPMRLCELMTSWSVARMNLTTYQTLRRC